MDRPIEAAVQRRRTVRRTLTVAIPIVAVLLALIWLPGWIRPSLSRSAIRTARVTAGPIEAVIMAAGTVVPEVERIVASPLDARVLHVLKRPGDTLNEGDPLVTLDASESELTVRKLEKDLALKDNQQAQTRLVLEKSLIDLEGRLDVKRLQLQSLRAALTGDRQLFKEGLISQETLRRSELSEAQAAIELTQLERERDNARAANRLQASGLTLERSSLERETTQARHQLDLATTKSDRRGVVTWALTEEGGLVRRGDVIARIADLRSFRVDATVSDVHAGKITPGAPVTVVINDTAIPGRVGMVNPSIDNGTVSFRVLLSAPAHAALRPNLRVDVFVVTARKPRALQVRKGPFMDATGATQIFVIRDQRAIRIPVRLGLASVDTVEIEGGVSEGDEVIVSNLQDYLHLKELKIR